MLGEEAESEQHILNGTVAGAATLAGAGTA
jgi:hypothetical protein